ncbi:MAG: hypothetical protein ABIH11_03450 [Candidatus Altiarchaeota archaeon]
MAREKDHNRYLVYRAYIVYVILLTILVMGGGSIGFPPKEWRGYYMTLMAACMIPAAFMLFSIFIFPWQYSMFGRLERTGFPDEKPVYARKYSYGRIGLFNASSPFIDWIVFPSGLGVNIRPGGKAFIPLEKIDLEGKTKTMTDRMVFFTPFEKRIGHTSEEINGPLWAPKGVYEALEELKRKKANGTFLSSR